MKVDERTVAGVPILLVSTAAPENMPTVLWFHGFGVDKETHRKELELLAQAGFLAVGVDSVGHGKRRWPDLDARQAAPTPEALRTVVELSTATAAEVPALIRTLSAERLSDPRRIGIAGISMGGYIVYRAAIDEPSIRAAVAILGSPAWPTGDSPDQHVDELAQTALLSVTAERDVNVPPDAARALHRALEQLGGRGESRYVEIAGADHFLAHSWEIVMRETIDWLARHLGVSNR